MQIDIDFEVFKALTSMRREERDSLNDVIRRLVRLDTPDAAGKGPITARSSLPGCVFKGVHFPEGTRFRASYKGKTYLGLINEGVWTDEAGDTYSSPSQAAFAIQKSGVNGWTFWECKRPEDVEWARLCSLRTNCVPLSEAVPSMTIKQ